MDEIYEILEYLPINDLEIENYVTPLIKSAEATFEKEEYQFSYFAIHLIFMTYIYSAVWKIGQFHKNNYEYSLLFARPYNGSKVNLKEIKSVFDYSFLPEKDIFEFFTLIGLDKSYVTSTKKLIDYRNEMAHATGKLQIITEENYYNAINEILTVIKNIHEKLSISIRDWYKKELLDYAENGLNPDYSSIIDYINDVFINEKSFSKQELLVCKEFGLSKFKNKNEFDLTEAEIEQIKEFHNSINEIYYDITGIDKEE